MLEPPTNDFHAWMQNQNLVSSGDEYERYIREPVLEVSNALAWWLDPVQRSRFPQLSCLAVDLLSIPAMSAEAERLFSNARRTISDDRNRLEINTIEALECLKSWLKSGILDPTNIEHQG